MNTIFRLSIIYTMLFFASLTRKTVGENKLPVFTGMWFDTSFLNCGDRDACGVELCVYNNFYSSPTAVLENSMGPPFPGCTWDYNSIYSYSNETYMPPGFISTNEHDWNKIVIDPNAALFGIYEISCRNEYGGTVTSVGKWVSPFYNCPSGTRLSYDNVTFEMGCTTTPTPCVGDVVGRDLSSTGFEDLGHVGLVTTFGKANPKIMEVLEATDYKPAGIFLNPLYGKNSFTTKTQYWGSRYEPLDFTRLPLTLASQVIQAGIDQQQYLFNYTLGWFYYPGGTDEYPDSCEFRCDSFVYYCYDAGAQIKLQPYFEYPLTAPLSMFTYDFSCSADPVEYCSAYTVTQNTTLTLLNKARDIDFQRLKHSDHTSKVTTDAQKIFQSLRPALATEPAQKNQLPQLIEQYQGDQNPNISELFVRCLCFELEKMNSSQINQNIRPLLSNLLWQYKYLSNDNFLLALMENTLSFYLENPHCDWLSAFFTVKAETQVDKEAGMIAYVDQQDNATEKANLVTASRFSSFFTLTDEKRRAYGSLFRQAYQTDKSLSEKAKKLILLGLSEMKTSVTEKNFQTQFFQKPNTIFSRNVTSRFNL